MYNFSTILVKLEVQTQSLPWQKENYCYSASFFLVQQTCVVAQNIMLRSCLSIHVE